MPKEQHIVCILYLVKKKDDKKTKQAEKTENPTKGQNIRKGKENQSQTKGNLQRSKFYKESQRRDKPGQHYAKPKPKPESCTKSKPRYPILNLKP